MYKKLCYKLFTICICLIFPIISHAQISITEIMYDPAGGDTVGGKGREWVEIYNDSDSEVDLIGGTKGWKFNDGSNHTLNVPPANGGQGSIKIPGKSYLILANDAVVFLSEHSGYSGSVIDTVISLGQQKDQQYTVQILKEDGTIADTVSYSTNMGASDNGNSLQKTNSVWISAAPTPGTSNASTDTEPKGSGSDTGGGSGSTTTSTTATSTATTTSTNNSNSGGYTYVYSSSVSLSTYETPTLNVEAGRERIAFLHSPIEFKAMALDKKSGNSVSGARYLWAYGDGTSGEGETVSHQYIFPGEYNVVLNSYSGSNEAVDVTKVKVVEANVSVVFTDAYLEVTNQSDVDLNIGGWKVKSGDKEYVIPRDTIISQKSSIKIPKQAFGKVGENAKIVFVYPDGQLISELQILTDADKQKIIAEISARIFRLQTEMADSYTEANSDQVGSNESFSRLISTKDVSKKEVGKESSSENSTAAPIQAEASRSIVSKVIDFFGMMFK